MRRYKEVDDRIRSLMQQTPYNNAALRRSYFL